VKVIIYGMGDEMNGSIRPNNPENHSLHGPSAPGRIVENSC
jgi:hypothetical protein